MGLNIDQILASLEQEKTAEEVFAEKLEEGSDKKETTEETTEEVTKEAEATEETTKEVTEEAVEEEKLAGADLIMHNLYNKYSGE
ncbi:hypothetical protein HN682_07245 [Candidatus Peregrinibacteria bacterium]|nr:hypothetical protein [Candidatus Peregrinibacteria bacterium]